ncbi:MAG: hypothetical protein AAF196_10130 [Planctomycetota bacterium]
MSSAQRDRIGWIALFAVLFVGVALNLVLRTPLETSAFTVYRDDAYYYFAMVESLARGERPEVSDRVPTNGGQFGWMVMLLPTTLLGDEGPERSARWVGLGCLLWAGVVLGRHLRAVTGRREAFVLGLLGLCATPLLWVEAQNGQETGLVVLTTVFVFVNRKARDRVFVTAGVCAILARVDLIFFVYAIELVRLRPQARSWLHCLLHVPQATCYGLLAWTTLNIAMADLPWSDAGSPMPWLFWNRFLATDPDTAAWLHHTWYHGRPALLGGPFVTSFAAWSAALVAAGRWIPTRRSALVSLFALLGLALVFADDLEVPLLVATLGVAGIGLTDRGFEDSDPSSERDSHEAKALLIAAIFLVAFHGALRLYPRDYYWAPIAVFGVCWALSKSRSFGPVILASAVAVSFFVGDGSRSALQAQPGRAWQSVQEFAASQMSLVVPNDQKIGAFNAGLIRARSGREVVNLDGVVDQKSFHALRRHRLGEMLWLRGVDWILDHPVQLDTDPTIPHANGAWFGDRGPDEFRPRIRFLCPGVDAGRPGTEEIVLWQRRRSSVDRFATLGRELKGPRDLLGFRFEGREGGDLYLRRRGGFERIAEGRDGTAIVVVFGGELSEFAPSDLELFTRAADGSMIQVR